MECFKYGYAVAQLGHVAGKRESGRSRAHYGHFAPVMGLGFGHCGHVVLALPVGGKAFQIAYGHGLAACLEVKAF